MAQNSRFGQRRSNEERETDREKLMEQSKLSPSTLQKRANIRKVVLEYKDFRDSETKEEEFLDIDPTQGFEDTENNSNSKLSNDEAQEQFKRLVESQSIQDLDKFLADFVIDFQVNAERKKSLPPKWEPPSLGYLLNFTRKASIFILLNFYGPMVS